MFKYILKRIGLSLIILFGVSVILYTLVRMMPMDYIERKFATQLSQSESGAVQEKVNQLKDQYGLRITYTPEGSDEKLTLDETVIEKYDLNGWDVFVLKASSYINGYFTWLINAFQGDLGDSLIESRPVIDVITSKMGISFTIAFIATILQYIIAIPLGVVSATKQYGAMDYTVTVIAMMGISLPTFFFAALLTRVFSLQLGWFPLMGLTEGSVIYNPESVAQIFSSEWFSYNLDKLWHMVLPMVTLVVLSIGGLMRYTRTNMLEVLNSDYIRTARAKGLSEHSVIYTHAFRNSLIPLVTMFAGVLPGLFGGAMITETVFAIPGIGQIAYKAVSLGDINLIMAYNMFISVLTVVGTLLSDLMYAVVDPRVKLGK